MSVSLRIAMISQSLPVVGAKRGGIERVAHDLADGLAARGHRVEVWSHDPAPAGARYRVRPLPWAGFATTWLGRRLTAGYLGNVLAAVTPVGDADVVVAHGDSLLLPVRGRPVVRVMHGSALGEARSATTPWRAALQYGVYVQELLTGITQSYCVGVSENTRRTNPFVRRVIPNGIDLSLFSPEAGAKTTQPSVLFVGAMDGRKRGALLRDWFVARVRPRFADATLTIVGRAGEPAPGVTYREGVTPAELAALYRSAWLYASPSSYEGFGLPYVEAMASGTPVLATSNDGSREVTRDGLDGVLASDEAFAEQLVELLADAGRREMLARRGLLRARDFALSTMLDRYEAVLREAVGTRGALVPTA